MIRLDKFLADLGIGTRSEIKKYVKQGRVTVDGTVVKDSGLKFDETTAVVTYLGETLQYKKYSYFLFHKPAGCITADHDSMHRTVMDFFRNEGIKGLSPVGRLDLDTEGLLLVTNDGPLNHNLLSPAHHVPKTYFARVEGIIPADCGARFAEGIDIGDEKPTLPAELKVLSVNEAESICEAELTITEGRFHQVKRMFSAVGCEVVYLKRLSMGSLTLGDLPIGTYRKLTVEELEQLKN